MSAQTMRRIVKLAYAKQEKQQQEQQQSVFLSDRGLNKNKHLARGKTETDIRVQKGTTEEKVARRLSSQQQNKEPESLHIRSFSLPKEKTPLAPDSTKSSSTNKQEHEFENDNDNDNENENENENENQHAKHPTITITMVQSENDNNYNNKTKINNLPPMAMNNMLQPTIKNSQSGITTIHQSASSDTHTINSEFSESVYTEDATATEYTHDNESQYTAKFLKNNNKRGGGSLMSVNSMSSTVESSYMSSNKKAAPAGIRLETVQEPSANMKYADEEIMQQHSAGHTAQQSVVQHMTAPPLQSLATPPVDDEDEDDYQQKLSRASVDLTRNIQYETNNNSSSIWSCLCCCGSSSSSSTAGIQKPSSLSITGNSDKPELINNTSTADNYGDGDGDATPLNNSYKSNEMGGLVLDNDDWRTWKSGTSRMRRPTQYTTMTNNEDSTINVDDVRMWEDPFGKGASGRVFKGVYLPLCQVMALKVTSRLDNDNVKQILGEFKQQQEVLPDCDELMRIHGWYRNLKTNEIAVALEYMDMGSVYDSCFNTNNKSSVSAEEQIKTGHKQIIVDKISYDQLRFIARQVLLGLHALHTNSPPLIHRDIKPQNILISSFGSVKVADFGLLTALKNGVCSDSKGTSKYFSPERIQGSFDTLADIWSLGVTLIEIYKQELISAEDLDWFKIVEDGIDIDDFLPPTTPTEFIDFLKQTLQHDSEKRPSAKSLLQHQFITRKWGNPLAKPSDNNNNLKNVQVAFAKEHGDQKVLDRILAWLEEWILEDHENNGKLFLEGDSEYLKQCVLNLSIYSGLNTKYIDRYIADLYREYTQFSND